MFEIIGIIVVCWIVFKILKALISATSTVRSKEFGKEARHIATNTLKVPESYYNYMIINKMDLIKRTAEILPTHDEGFKNTSWPRLLALTIYGEFHQDCDQWQRGNPIKDQIFTSIGITPDMIASELSRDPTAVINANM